MSHPRRSSATGGSPRCGCSARSRAVPDFPTDRWPDIERLYNAALDLKSSDRDAYLARACGGDETLHREVRSLLDYERAADRFLERPAVAEAAWSIARETRPPLSGRRIAGY